MQSTFSFSLLDQLTALSMILTRSIWSLFPVKICSHSCSFLSTPRPHRRNFHHRAYLPKRSPISIHHQYAGGLTSPPRPFLPSELLRRMRISPSLLSLKRPPPTMSSTLLANPLLDPSHIPTLSTRIPLAAKEGDVLIPATATGT